MLCCVPNPAVACTSPRSADTVARTLEKPRERGEPLRPALTHRSKSSAAARTAGARPQSNRAVLSAAFPMGHDRAQGAIDISERMRNAARAKRTAVSAQRATVAAAASPLCEPQATVGRGGAHEPRVTLLLAGVGWLHT